MHNHTMQHIIPILILLLASLRTQAQEVRFRNNINKDSLLHAYVQHFPEDKRKACIKDYNEADKDMQELILFRLSQSAITQKDLVANLESKQAAIMHLAAAYRYYLPPNHTISIEFTPEGDLLTTPESVTIKVQQHPIGKQKPAGDRTITVTDWSDTTATSIQLDNFLKSFNWTRQTLSAIKKLLDDAGCISIENSTTAATIGFARSGMGKYSYKIFPRVLTEAQQATYNDGCNYIYYKENIVLEYGGGAIGTQCFGRE